MALDVYQDWLGIPEGPRPPDHYALLRLIPFEDDSEKVRKNYKKLNGHVRKYAGRDGSTCRKQCARVAPDMSKFLMISICILYAYCQIP